eukprot:374707_1
MSKIKSNNSILISLFLLGVIYYFLIYIIKFGTNEPTHIAVTYALTNLQINDVIKYRNTNHSACDILYYSQILIGAHHKTGTQLITYQLTTKSLVRYFSSKCWLNKYIKHQKKRIKMFLHLDEQEIQSFIDKTLNKIQKLKLMETTQIHIVFLHIIRNPIDTILSAYNYHKQGREPKWTKYKTVQSFPPNITARYYCQAMNISLNISIFTLINKFLTEAQGIYFEYGIYIGRKFDEIYKSYRKLNNLKQYHNISYDYNLIHIKQFRLEDFKLNFNKTCNEYLDTFGVLEDNDRQYLMNTFQQFSMNNPHRRGKIHGTYGTYNKTKQVEYLLKSQLLNVSEMYFDPPKQRCLILKKQTQMLGYQWDYHHIC